MTGPGTDTPAIPAGLAVHPATGELVAIEELAGLLAAAEAAAAVQKRDVDDARQVLAETLADAADYRAALAEVMAPGDLVRNPDGTEVACLPGPRGKRSIDREACAPWVEQLEGVGLVTPKPPPPPAYEWKGVAAFEAAALDLARAGVPLSGLIKDPDPPAPIIKVTTPKEGR